MQAGDTMETIALHVYGDSSLWYLIADANGVTDRRAVAGYSDSLHVGQRIMLPPAASGQHQTHATHKVLNMNELIGDTSATTSFPQPLPPKPKHHSFWSKVLIAAVAVVATVLTAGVLSVGMSGLGALFSAGLTALSGGVTGTGLGTTIATGFAAGFVGSLASQGAANALGVQHGLDMNGALLTGLATAATAGLGNASRGVDAFKQISATLHQHSLEHFNLASAAEMMEQNAASQAVNVSLRKHQHFDWTALAVSGVTGGYLGSASGTKLSERLKQIDHKTGILRAELSAIAGAGADSALTGTHFDAAQVLGDNLGGAVGNALVNTSVSQTPAEAIAALYLDDDQKNEMLANLSDGTYLTRKLNAYSVDEHSAFNTNANISYQYSEIPVRDNFSLFPEEESFCAIPKNASEKSDVNNKSITSELISGEYGMDSYSPLGYSPMPNMSMISDGFYDKKGVGLYDIDYDAFLAKKGWAYSDKQIVSYSFYKKTPGSPIAGDASREQQIEAIDALITVSKKSGLDLRDTAHVLAIARHESGFNRYAAAGTTSATGLGQFVKETGRKYHIKGSNRWDVFAQAEALVAHFKKNKALAKKFGLSDSYVYKFHHDGGNSQYSVETEGLRLSRTKIMPQIGNIIHAIKKIYY